MDKTIPTIGLIGGSGFDQIDGLENAQLVDLDTPMGKPSDSILIGNLGNVKVAFGVDVDRARAFVLERINSTH